MCVPSTCTTSLWVRGESGSVIEVDKVRQIPPVITRTLTVHSFDVLRKLGMREALATHWVICRKPSFPSTLVIWLS